MASGVLLALSMPKPGWWPLAWLGLAPLFVALRGRRAREALLYGLVAGVVYYSVVLYWLMLFGSLPWILVTFAETAFLALFSVAASRLMPGRIGWLGYLAVPAAWTLMQWARCLGPFALNWGSLAHTQANALPVIQIASITGPWGIDFLLCLVSLAFAETARPAPRKMAPLGVALALSAVVCISGALVAGKAAGKTPTIAVAVIQGNIRHDGFESGSMESAFMTFAQMSRDAAAAGADLIVWPETAITDDVTPRDWGLLLFRLAHGTSATYVVGGYDPATDPKTLESYNAAHFYGRDGRKLGVYHKVRLVPYGEFVPFRKQMPWLERYGIRDEDVLPGKSHRNVKTEFGEIGVSICFESLFPQVSRIETKNGAAALVVITNDEWFGRTQAARQHLMISRLRAVENRRYVARAAGTGISAIIDPRGRVVHELGLFRRGIVSGRIAPMAGLTPYARFGDWFAYACAGVVVVCLLTTRTFCSTCKSTPRE